MQMVEQFIVWFEMQGRAKLKREIAASIANGTDTYDFMSYKKLLAALCRALDHDSCMNAPVLDPNKIHEVTFSKYQGEMVFVIGSDNNEHWVTAVSYGSCAACDTLSRIHRNESPKQREEGYFTLCLHLLQKMKKV